MRFLRLPATITLSVAAAMLAFVLGELGLRWLDDQPLLSLTLPTHTAPPARRRDIDARIGGPLPADIDASWIDVDPPDYARPPVERELEALARSWRDTQIRPFELFRVWNRAMVVRDACRTDSIFVRLPQPLMTFDAPGGRRTPSHRYLPARTLPGGLTVNRFGWRGRDLALDKPAATIRVAFVGASTTVGVWSMPFSYPEYVVHWLNLWAQRNGMGVGFEPINAAREGFTSPSIAAALLDEVLPLEPDMVVFYEGANQSLCMQPGVRPARPQPSARRLAMGRWLARARPYLQSARRMESMLQRLDLHHGTEPPKPVIAHTWFPKGLDESAAVIDPELLPREERVIATDLDAMRTNVQAHAGLFVISSFVWLVRDGLQLDPRRHGAIYRMLNEMCWPVTYRDLRRAADLHNRVLRDYAVTNDVPFIDVAAQFPADPDLFIDAVHLGPDGTRAHAWLVFRALTPLVRERIAAGAWPRPDQTPLTEHPNIRPAEPLTVKCEAPPTAPVPTPAPRDERFW